MSFIKALFLAIIATIFLTYVFGHGLIEMLNVNVYMDERLTDPIKSISIAALIVMIIFMAASAIILSVFGSILFISMLVFGVIAIVTLGVFWPIFLVVTILWLLSRDKRNNGVKA